MDDILEINLILDKQKYNLLYRSSFIILIIVIVTICIIFTFKYQSYYKTMGTMIDNKLELLVNIGDIKFIKDNQEIYLDDKKYHYHIVKIDEALYRDDNYQNYQKIYLEITSLSSINNYTYQVKIPKENKLLASYINDILKEE